MRFAWPLVLAACGDVQPRQTAVDPQTDTTGRLATCAADGPVSRASHTYSGIDPGDELGRRLAGGGDLTGDGLDDLVLSSFVHDDQAGEVWVHAWPFGSDPAIRVVPSGPEERMGSDLAMAGDSNGDGVVDLLVGAAGWSGAAGAVFLFESPFDPELDPGDATVRIEGAYPGQGLTNMAPGADFDGSGGIDLLVASQGTSQVYLFTDPQPGVHSALDSDTSIEAPAANLLGRLALAGDIDGDGLPDALMAAEAAGVNGAESGAIWVLHGPLPSGTRSANEIDTMLYGPSGSLAGHGIDGLGDVDGDGSDDIGVGAPYESTLGPRRGRAYVVRSDVTGPTALDEHSILDGEAAEDRFGFTLAGPGDVDGDGFADLLVGAKFHDEAGTDSGSVYLVLGPIEGAVDVATDPSAFEWTGSAAGDETGPVTRLGDVDGNGLNDLVIGARFSDLGGPDSGTAYVILCGTAP